MIIWCIMLHIIAFWYTLRQLDLNAIYNLESFGLVNLAAILQ